MSINLANLARHFSARFNMGLIRGAFFGRPEISAPVKTADHAKALGDLAPAMRTAFNVATLDLMRSTGKDTPELRRAIGR